jgi:hypothetical protein
LRAEKRRAAAGKAGAATQLRRELRTSRRRPATLGEGEVSMAAKQDAPAGAKP